MKKHFLQLINYDRFANETILALIVMAGNPGKAVQIMAHLLAAQKTWTNRLLAIDNSATVLWPAAGAHQGDFQEKIAEQSDIFINYIRTLDEVGFDKIITYQNSRGEIFSNSVIDIITHVINHGTHHRAQIGQLLKLNGVDNLPFTDYIIYIRTLNS